MVNLSMTSPATGTITGTFSDTPRAQLTFTPSSAVNFSGYGVLSAAPIAAKVQGGVLTAMDGTPLSLTLTTEGDPVGSTGFWYWTVRGIPGADDFSFFLTGDADISDLVHSPAPGTGSQEVISVNAKTGVVVLSAADVGAATETDITEAISQIPAPESAVTGVFGRTGAVTAQTGDYSVSQVTGAAAESDLTAEVNRAEAAEAQALPAGVTVVVPAPTGQTATDTPNIQAAIAKLGTTLGTAKAATLLFQDGTYQIDSNSAVIQGLSNFTVRSLGGAVITQAPNTAAKPNNTSGDLFVIADCTDFRVEDMTFDGMRDVVAPITLLTAAAVSGQPSVTVAAGAATGIYPGQWIGLFGGNGSSEQAQHEGGYGQLGGSSVASVTPGAGANGGDLVTFTANLANSYTQVNGVLQSDGFGSYACTGAYLSLYQPHQTNTVAGRSFNNEDQQNALHLLNCQRGGVSRVTARNVWASQIKLGSGFAASSLTDGCQQVTVSGCTVYHGYDQGVSIWKSKNVVVTGCLSTASGWSGIDTFSSDNCLISGNVVSSSVYSVPNSLNNGQGIAIEGGTGNVITNNRVEKCGQAGIYLKCEGPATTWAVASGKSALSAAAAAGSTTLTVTSSSVLKSGATYGIYDGVRTEAFTVAALPNSTTVTTASPVKYTHSANTPLFLTVACDTTVADNSISDTPTGIAAAYSARSRITGNTILRHSVSGVDLHAGQPFSGYYMAGPGSVISSNVVNGGTAGNAVNCNGADHVAITKNNLTGQVVNSSTPVVSISAVQDLVIEGNVIHGNSLGSGIQGNNSGGLAASRNLARVLIAGNHVSYASNEGIILMTGDSCTITGNIVNSCGGNAGIDLRGVSHSIVAGNICTANKKGIQLEDQSTAYCLNNRVTGNTCRDDGSGVAIGTGAAQVQQTGILESGNSNNNLFAFNECDGNTSAQLTVIGAGSVQTRNIISGTIQAS